MPHSRTLTLAAASILLAAGTAGAQQDSTVRIDERWRAYLGCWDTRSAEFAGPLVCVVPTSAPGTVELLTITGDTVLNRTSVSATGDRVRVTRDGCTGSETGRFSADDRRIYTTADFTCAGGVTQQTQSLFSMVRRDAFTRVDGLRTRSGTTAVRLTTFTAVTVDSTDVPVDVARRLPSMQSMPTYAARIDASALLSPADVADAAQALDAPVVEAWLVDRGEGLVLDAKQLRALRDAKVPGSVTDLLIALANPRLFQIAQGGVPGARADIRAATGASGIDCTRRPDLCAGRGGYRGYDYPYGFADIFDPFFGMGYGYGRYGYSRYGVGFYNGYYGSCFNSFNCGGYGWGNNGFGWGNGGTIVVVPQPAFPTREQGRAINGSGYSQRGSSSSGGGREAQATPTVSNGGGYGGGGGSSSNGSGSSSNGGGSSSNGGGGERTAKPRP